MKDAVDRALSLPKGQRHLIALVGPPASGKSTLAETLAKALRDAGRAAQVVPMDGFHLDNRLLTDMDLLHRKGAPETFDRRGFARLLDDIKRGGAVVYPVFDRDRDLSIAGAATLPCETELAIVEGNYLLFDAPGWRDLTDLWSLSIWLDVPEPVLRARLIDRWRSHGLNDGAARARAEQNDLPNATRMQTHRLPADITLSSG